MRRRRVFHYFQLSANTTGKLKCHGNNLRKYMKLKELNTSGVRAFSSGKRLGIELPFHAHACMHRNYAIKMVQKVAS